MWRSIVRWRLRLDVPSGLFGPLRTGPIGPGPLKKTPGPVCVKWTENSSVWSGPVRLKLGPLGRTVTFGPVHQVARASPPRAAARHSCRREGAPPPPAADPPLPSSTTCTSSSFRHLVSPSAPARVDQHLLVCISLVDQHLLVCTCTRGKE